MFTFNRKRLILVSLCTGLAATSAVVIPAYAEEMNPGTMSHDAMMAKPMMGMKEAMKDESMKMQMTSDLAKMMVMQHMAMEMCMDGKCQKMMADDPEMMKMVAAAKAMTTDPTKMKMMKDQISADPEAMKKVMMMTMAQSAMMKDKMGMDHGMDKMNDAGMKPDKMK